MQVAIRTTSRLVLGLAAALALGTQVEAQERAGVVTTLEGQVTVMRASLQQPAPLKFKDDIFVKDRIATGENSVARILLGGKAVVTVREHSVVTITEVPGLSTVDVAAGRAAVAVAREKMRAGDLVEVKTPNAVAGIRGTVIVAEVLDAQHSVITVLKGVIDVKGLDGGRLVGRPTIVNALQRVTVAGGAAVSTPQAISSDAAKNLGQEFRVAPPRAMPAAVTAAVNEAEVDRATRQLAAIAALKASEHARGHDDDDGDRRAGDVVGRDLDDTDAKAQKLRKAERARNRGLAADRSTDSVVIRSTGRAPAAIGAVSEVLKSAGRHKGKYRDGDR